MKPSEIKEKVNQFVIDRLEEGEIPREKTRDTIQVSGATGKPYGGINQLILQIQKNDRGYSSNRRLTYKATKQLGGAVKKGEKGTLVVYYKTLRVDERQDDGSTEQKNIPLLRHFYVFNLDQTSIENLNGSEVIELQTVENIIDNFADRPEIKQGSKPCYIPQLDVVKMPNRNNFTTTEEYYATLLHELVHSTGAEKRLNRKGVTATDGYGGEVYSEEELIAEMGASYLGAFAGIQNATKENSRAYINGWLKALRNDKNILISASSKARKATEYVLNSKENLMDILAS